MSELKAFFITAFLLFVAFAASVCCAEVPKGLWLTPRKDSSNQARADVAGNMTDAPREVWRMSTGGEVRFARQVSVEGRECVLVHAGLTLQVSRPSGETVWRNSRAGVTRVLYVADFDRNGQLELLAQTDARTVVLVDVVTGTQIWMWQFDPSTFISGFVFQEIGGGVRWMIFPGYSLEGFCWDFSGNCRKPKLLWRKKFGRKYTRGYGPSIILTEMDGDDEPDIVLSSKRSNQLYQAVIDSENGAIKAEVVYDPAPGASFRCGRPYGLLRAADLHGDGKPDIVMVSCQVEEYLAVTNHSKSAKLSRGWGHFVEKDWPRDEREIRPQVTSLADVTGDGTLELIVGRWQGDKWQTLVIDPRRGFDQRRATLDGLYFWGCHDLNGDHVAEVIVSRESKRKTRRVTTLHALNGKSLRPLATLHEASVLTSSDSPLRSDTAFMAQRRSVVFIKTDDGISGILVHRYQQDRETGTFLWGSRRGGEATTRPLTGPGSVRADLYENRLLLSDGAGSIQRFDENLAAIGEPLTTRGRICTPLVWAVGDRRELIVDVAGGKLVGGAPDWQKSGQMAGRWKIVGMMAAAHVDATGQSRLAVFDPRDPDRPAVAVYAGRISSSAKPRRIVLSHPAYLGLVPYGREFRLAVNLRTGVHTMALATFDKDGRLLWQDKGFGAHPRIPAAADIDGDGKWEVIADDHGTIRIYAHGGSVLATHKRWPPAYTLPIIGPFASKGEALILRSSGIQALSLVDRTLKPRWLQKCDIWRYYKSLAAVGDTSGNGNLRLGALTEDGKLICLDVADGRTRWSYDVGVTPHNTSVIAADVNGNGRDEFLIGLVDGRLIAVGETDGQPNVLWQAQFDAAVANPIVADIDADGRAEIVISTSDGYVRVLKAIAARKHPTR